MSKALTAGSGSSSELKYFECLFCPQKFLTQEETRRHQLRHCRANMNSPPGIEQEPKKKTFPRKYLRFQCSKCLSRFPTNQDRTTHELTAHYRFQDNSCWQLESVEEVGNHGENNERNLLNGMGSRSEINSQLSDQTEIIGEERLYDNLELNNIEEDFGGISGITFEDPGGIFENQDRGGIFKNQDRKGIFKNQGRGRIFKNQDRGGISENQDRGGIFEDPRHIFENQNPGEIFEDHRNIFENDRTMMENSMEDHGNLMEFCETSLELGEGSVDLGNHWNFYQSPEWIGEIVGESDDAAAQSLKIEENHERESGDEAGQGISIKLIKRNKTDNANNSGGHILKGRISGADRDLSLARRPEFQCSYCSHKESTEDDMIRHELTHFESLFRP